MKLQPALSKTLRQTLLQFSCLSLAAAVAENIIGKTLKRDILMVFGHPPVERVVKEQVTQQG